MTLRLPSSRQLMVAVEEEVDEELLAILEPFVQNREACVDHVRSESNSEASHYALMRIDEALFKLAVPLMDAFQITMIRQVDQEQVGLFSENTRTIKPELVSMLAKLPDYRHRLRAVFYAVSNLAEYAIHVTCTEQAKNPRFVALTIEYAKHRYLVDALFDPSTQLANLSLPELSERQCFESFAMDTQKGISSGSRFALRLFEVLPRVAIEHSIEPTRRLMENTFTNGQLLSAISRQKGVSASGFDRLASKCDQTCFGTDQEIAEKSPHRHLLQQYQNDYGVFRNFHCSDVWYEPSAFSLYGESVEEAQMGPAFDLPYSTDPKYKVRVSEVPARRRRMGCPVIPSNHPKMLDTILFDLCIQPVIWDHMVNGSFQTATDLQQPLKSGSWKKMFHGKSHSSSPIETDSYD